MFARPPMATQLYGPAASPALGGLGWHGEAAVSCSRWCDLAPEAASAEVGVACRSGRAGPLSMRRARLWVAFATPRGLSATMARFFVVATRCLHRLGVRRSLSRLRLLPLSAGAPFVEASGGGGGGDGSAERTAVCLPSPPPSPGSTNRHAPCRRRMQCRTSHVGQVNMRRETACAAACHASQVACCNVMVARR